jgi:hypothetical protein
VVGVDPPAARGGEGELTIGIAPDGHTPRPASTRIHDGNQHGLA